MAIFLNSYSAGDTTYVGKLNNDMGTISTAIAALQAAGGAAGGGTADLNDIWEQDGLVGASSFLVNASSNTHLSFTSGSVWRLADLTRGRATSHTLLNFVGKASATYQIIVDGAGGLTVSTASAQVTIYQIAWNNPGFGSAQRLVPILLHGNDYQRMLSSVQFGSFTRVGDRFSTLEATLVLDTFFAQSAVSGTQWFYKAGQSRNNNVITSAAGSHVSLLATSSLYVEVDPATGTVSVASGGFTSGSIPLRYLRSSGGSLVSNEDRRTWAVQAVSGGGGVAGITVSGTTNPRWTVATSVISAQSAVTGGFRMNRGADVANSAPEIRWNESNTRWEFTGDSVSYYPLEALANINIGARSMTRFTMIASAPTVLNLVSQSNTSAPPYATLALSAYISTTAFAVLLRGQVLDPSPGGIVSGGPVPGILFFRDSATVTTDAAAKVMASPVSFASTVPRAIYSIVVPVSDQKCVYDIKASSNLTATVTFALQGFWDTQTGVGTQRVSGIKTSMAVSATNKADFNLSASEFGGVMNRGTVYFLETSGSNAVGAGSLYDITFFATSAFAASQIQFEAINIDASAVYTTRLPWVSEDLDSSTLLHVRISNAGTNSGLFSLKLIAERFATLLLAWILPIGAYLWL